MCRSFARLGIFGVLPVFPEKNQAINYLECSACFRSGEIRILDSADTLQHTVAFSEANRKL
jgi:hypothetical protein